MHHLSIQTRDWEGSLRLYRDVLGMTPVASFEVAGRPFMLLDIGDGSHLELMSPLSTTAAPENANNNNPLAHFALTTTDVRASIAKIRYAGYVVTVEPKDVHLQDIDATIAFFTGPNGEQIELFQVVSA